MHPLRRLPDNVARGSAPGTRAIESVRYAASRLNKNIHRESQRGPLESQLSSGPLLVGPRDYSIGIRLVKLLHRSTNCVDREYQRCAVGVSTVLGADAPARQATEHRTEDLYIRCLGLTASRNCRFVAARDHLQAGRAGRDCGSRFLP